MDTRRVLEGWLVLVVLYTVIQRGAAGRISGVLGGLTSATRRLSDPKVALIPDIAGRGAEASAPRPATPTVPGQNVPTSAPFSVPINV